MDKRLLLAVGLSLLVLLSWSALVTKTQRLEYQNVTIKKPLPIPLSQPRLNTPGQVNIPSSAGRLKYTHDKYEINFITSLGAIDTVAFKDYQLSPLLLHQGFLWGDPSLIFALQHSSAEEVTFAYQDAEKRITKRYLLHNSSYAIGLELELTNISSTPLHLNLPLVLGVLNFSGDPNEARFQDVTVATSEKILHLNGRGEKVLPEARFLGLRNRYFCSLIEPEEKSHWQALIRRINAQESEIALAQPATTLLPGQTSKQTFRIYLGPQDLNIIKRINPEWSAVMYYGSFDLISHLLLQLLGGIYRLVHNWGWAIIILSVMIYFLLYPLTLKQMRSMKEMQTLQPQIEELRKLYSNNPQKLNKEILALYREHKVNPLAGCLPLILQMPIFFALYQALIRAIALKGAKFLWIKDLSEPDRLFILPFALPILGKEINILPLIMAIGMFIQQKISMPTSGTGSAEQQKLMQILFPIMFGLIFYRMPGGLVLYWLMNSLLMLAQQLRISRKT